jgi:putative ABC transport system permease protein
MLLGAGLMIGNALIACGGAIEAERSGGFSQHMGTGIILIGIAVLVLGESLMKSFIRRTNLYLRQYLAACIVGVFAYSFVIQAILSASSAFVDIRLLSTLVLIVVLAYAAYFHSNARELF